MNPPVSCASHREVVPLWLLAAGEGGTVVAIDGQPDLVVRLQEMGMRPGCQVHVIRAGSVSIVAVGNHRFGFRGSEAAFVMVEISTPQERQG